MRRFLLPLLLVASVLTVPVAHAGGPVATPLPAFDFTDSTCCFEIGRAHV